jgi:acyl-[acyl-carrier-protein]-phospholipid O-acyltransferase/long-chain-fatty-acid--[acyl-carrier-protein] ligase
MATPTFLQFYVRSCDPGDFGSLRFAMVSAEKLPDWLANAFEEKFGLRPVEGYGCTECAPVVTCGTRDFRAAGFRQVGSRRGSIGQPLPGVSVRIVSPDTGAPLPLGEPGLLLVRGPNVMRGYLGHPGRQWADVLLAELSSRRAILEPISGFAGDVLPPADVDRLQPAKFAPAPCRRGGNVHPTGERL